jgi:hypothetical protein
MNRRDVFSSRLEIGACFSINPKKATPLLFFLANCTIEPFLKEEED